MSRSLLPPIFSARSFIVSGPTLKFLIHFFLIYLLFMAVLGLRFCARAFSSCGKRGPLLIAVHGPLTIAASPVVEHRLQTRRPSNCGSRAQPLRGTWDPPRPGLEPVSPASAGRFSTTAPPGKPLNPFWVNSYVQRKIVVQFHCHLQIVTVSILPFKICMPFVSFSCLIAVARTPSTILHRVVRVSILVLFLILEGKLSGFHHWG